MMVEETQMRTFVSQQLREAASLSTLTLGILKRQYLAYVGHESLSPEARSLMKRVVEEELMKMQDSNKDVSESENATTMPSKHKRKREEENKEAINGVDEDESRAKRCRHQSSSPGSSDSESEKEEQMNTIESGDEEQRMNKSQDQMHGVSEEETKSKEEESDESAKCKQDKRIEQNSRRAENGVKTSEEKKPSSQSDDEDEINTDGEKENTHKHNSSDSSEEAVDPSEETKGDELVQDSDSSSLPSLEDEQDSGEKNTQAKKKTTVKTESGSVLKGDKEDDKAVLRLKRYISLCGVRRNYKKLLDGCRSIRSKVAVLKKELEDLGVQGQPSIEKCKKARLKREQAEELAELDVSNIIATQDEALVELKDRHLGGWGIAQIAAGTGLAVYAMWAGILQPGFRKVPLRLQVPYLPASKTQVQNVMTLLRGRQGNLVDLGSGDGRIVLEAHRQGFSPAIGYELNPWLVRLSQFHAWRAGHHGKVSYRREDLWKVNLTDCKNVTVFLAPSVLSLLQEKLQAELPDDALVVAGRFPFLHWTPCRTEGHGVDQTWAYSMQAQRQHTCKERDTFSPTAGDLVSELTKEK
ncbi:adenine nucleotide translocase lysine N-methyltransferase [Polymixia lowei]